MQHNSSAHYVHSSFQGRIYVLNLSPVSNWKNGLSESLDVINVSALFKKCFSLNWLYPRLEYSCIFSLLNDSIQTIFYRPLRSSSSVFSVCCHHVHATKKNSSFALFFPHRIHSLSCVLCHAVERRPTGASTATLDKRLRDEKSYLLPLQSQDSWLIIISAALVGG